MAASQLDRGGGNLASVFQRLKNKGPADWAAVLLDVQAGLGADVGDVAIDVPAPGFGELGLVIDGLATIPASQLSDGQLSYLALVALTHLKEEACSVLLFDEPELHLHPGLLVRATWLFERLAERHPVILATHADAVLDALTDEAEAVRIVQLDGKRRTQILKLSGDRLKKWSEQYSTVSELRREGLLSDVVEARGEQ